jgi:hypothetical protein
VATAGKCCHSIAAAQFVTMRYRQSRHCTIHASKVGWEIGAGGGDCLIWNSGHRLPATPGWSASALDGITRGGPTERCPHPNCRSCHSTSFHPMRMVVISAGSNLGWGKLGSLFSIGSRWRGECLVRISSSLRSISVRPGLRRLHHRQAAVPNVS